MAVWTPPDDAALVSIRAALREARELIYPHVAEPATGGLADDPDDIDARALRNTLDRAYSCLCQAVPELTVALAKADRVPE